MADSLAEGTEQDMAAGLLPHQCHPPSNPAPALAPTAPRSPHVPNPLPHLRAPARDHRQAHAHEPRLPAPDTHGAPGTRIGQATASPAPAQDVARRILGEDMTQIDDYTERVKRMVGKVHLQRHHPLRPGRLRPLWAGRSCDASGSMLSTCSAARRWLVCSLRSLRLRAPQPPRVSSSTDLQPPGSGFGGTDRR